MAVSDPLRIGLYSPAWPAGSEPNGIVTYVGVVAPEIRAAGHHVVVIAGQVEPARADGIPAYSLAELWQRSRPARFANAVLYRTSPAWAFAQSVRFTAGSVDRIVREQRVQLLEMEESLGIARSVARRLSVPVVVRLHGPWFLNGPVVGVPEDRAFLRRVEAERRAVDAAAGWTAPSQDVLDRVRRYYGLALEHAEVIPYPCQPVEPGARWRLEGCDPRRLLFIGRFDRHKGGDLALDAFGRVWRACPEARLTFVGPDRGFLDDAGRRWTIPEYVRERLPDAMAAGAVELLGQRAAHELPALRRSALATLVPSRYETFGYTVLEAMSAGCPTIAADAGGIPEIIEDGVTGLLHRPGDAEHLAARILELLRDPGRAAKLGEAGGRAGERFYPQAIVPRMLAYYAALLRRR